MLAALAALLLAGMRMRLIADRYNPLAPIDLAEAPNFLTGTKLWMIAGSTTACVDALRRAGVAVQEMPKRRDRPGCERLGTVTISRLSRARLDAEEMRCDTALRLYLLERHAVVPLARRELGAEVERIEHFGSYSCRTIRDSSRLSEHARANAFDLAGFRLANGRTVSLKTDWASGGAEARFLRAVRTRACLLFNMVLSPDYDAAHADHFHFDMGWIRGCR
jgi:hypothetical protein